MNKFVKLTNVFLATLCAVAMASAKDLPTVLVESFGTVDPADLKRMSEKPDLVAAVRAIKVPASGAHSAAAAAELYVSRCDAELELAWWRAEDSETRMAVLFFILVSTSPERFQGVLDLFTDYGKRFGEGEAAKRREEMDAVQKQLKILSKELLFRIKKSGIWRNDDARLKKLQYYSRD